MAIRNLLMAQSVAESGPSYDPALFLAGKGFGDLEALDLDRTTDSLTLFTTTTQPIYHGHFIASLEDGRIAIVDVNTSDCEIFNWNGSDIASLEVINSISAQYLRGFCFSPDGNSILFYGGDDGPIGAFLYHDTGTGFSAVASPFDTIVDYDIVRCRYSPDGNFLLVCYTTANVSPGPGLYSVSGTTFVKQQDIANSYFSGAMFDCGWSNDSQYFAITCTNFSTSPISFFKWDGITLTKLGDPATLPTDDVYAVAFSPVTHHIAVLSQGAPYMSFYKLDTVTDTVTKLADPVTNLLTAPIDESQIVWDHTGDYVAVAVQYDSPYVTVYKRDGDVFAKLADPAALPDSSVRSLAFTPPAWNGA